MAAPKGNKNNPNGRPKGVPNKSTKAVREVLVPLVDELALGLEEKLDQLEPKEWINAYVKLLQFVLPKPQPAIEAEDREEIERMFAAAAIIAKSQI